MGRGHRRDAEAGAFGKARVVGEPDRKCLRHGDVLRGGAEGTLPLAVPGPDPLADPARRNAAADRVDDPGGIAVRNDLRKRDSAGATLARLHVGGIDPGGGNPDPDLSGAWRGRLDLADPQHVPGGTVRFIIGSAHEVAVRGSAGKVAPFKGTRDQSAAQRPAPGVDAKGVPDPPAGHSMLVYCRWANSAPLSGPSFWRNSVVGGASTWPSSAAGSFHTSMRVK